jgi:hypothetical protein
MTSLAERYAEMSENDLRRAADDVKSLTVEARTLLRAEFERRQLSISAINWGAHLSLPRPRRTTTLIGDAAGEYREMERGRYHAWVHVAVSFVYETALFSLLAVLLLRALFPATDVVGLAVDLGVVPAVAVYWNRWRCIEAYTSEWCTGILNLSILTVPFVALFYANYRGLRKLRGR